MSKLRFRNLYTTHNIGAERLAANAGVIVDVIDRMLTDRRVFEDQAEKVLSAFSKLTGETYTLDTVHVPLIKGTQSEVDRVKQYIIGEYIVGRRALHDTTLGTAKHAFITKRMENLQKGMERLTKIIGDDETMEFFQSLEVEPKDQDIQANG